MGGIPMAGKMVCGTAYAGCERTGNKHTQTCRDPGPDIGVDKAYDGGYGTPSTFPTPIRASPIGGNGMRLENTGRNFSRAEHP